jgi:hypothetical protein
MADEEQLKILRQGVVAWNKWREENPEVPNLRGVNLREAHLSGADLRRVNLSEAHLIEANLFRAHLSGADLSGANLFRVNLRGAYLSGADLRRANLFRADLSEANLMEANLFRADLSEAKLMEADLRRADLGETNLSGADLRRAQLVQTDLCNTTLTGSYVYGTSVWDIKVNDQTNQQNLVITRKDEAAITVDNIKVAQFIYLLLNNKEIRDAIDTIGKKAVLILGRFSDERKPVLDSIRDELRKHNYLPILFDFQPSVNQTTLETIKTLANMARLVIADLTDARSVLQELGTIVPSLPSIAVRLLIKKSEHAYGMLDYIRAYRSVVENTYEYENVEEMIASIKENVIGPAEAKVKELRQAK